MRRRAALILPLLGAACAGEERPPSPEPGPIGYGYLTPLPLNVARIVIAPEAPPPAPGDLGATLPVPPAEAVRTMGRDRLSAVGMQGEAVFTVAQASLRPTADGLLCQVGCRLEILGEGGRRLGFIEAEARAAVAGPEASRAGAADRLLRRAMDQLNVEFEYQLKRNLRDWLVAVPPGATGVPAPPPAGVREEPLPAPPS
ncbi:MAG TPA: hypothetical protein VE684_09475 [Crenalkalicoccus sp.]|nr:hypothetical protein [Crenalkalicoccus sp.]